MNQASVKIQIGEKLAPHRPAISWLIVGAWLAFCGSFTVCTIVIPPGPRLTVFGDVAISLAAVFAAASVLANVINPPRRSQAFWAFFGLGVAAWMAGQFLWTYLETFRHQPIPDPYLGDVILFLHAVPMIGALALRPHDRRDDLRMHLGYINFTLLLLWWVYLYLFIVTPWQYVSLNVARYDDAFDSLEGVQNLFLAGGLAVLYFQARGRWRTIYAHLCCAALLFAVGVYVSNVAIGKNLYYTGSPYDLPLVAALVWFGTAGLVAFQTNGNVEAFDHASKPISPWPARLALVAVFSMPVMALYAALSHEAPPAVRSFQIAVTQIAVIAAGLLVFTRQRLVDRDREHLLKASQDALENLRHIQTQMVQTEKLVSLGQLAAGAAHEINNPLTGILGYSEMLASEGGLTEKQQALADKTATLARRIKTLVANLLSFARRVPPEVAFLDVGEVINSALNLSSLDMRGKGIRTEFVASDSLPPVRGDANQLMQVFFNLVDNAIDALDEVGGGVLTIRATQKDASVILEFSDTGPGIKSPNHVFDPFFTTKPVGKGTGLGLSISYGIIQEHGGKIECFNRRGGGATFRITLPAAVEIIAQKEKPESSDRLATHRDTEHAPR
jgi:signal transduction histidine kinase